MNKIKRFLSTSAIYFAGNILSKLVTFFLLPLYTKYIVPNQYGEYDLVLTFINLVAPIAFFQIWDGMFRFSFDSDREGDKYKIINNAVLIFVCGFALYLLLFYLVYKFYHFEYWWSSITYGFLFAVQYIVSYAARIFLKNTLFVFSGLINTFVTAITNIVLIVVYHWDVESLYVAASIGCFVQIALIGIKLRLVSHFKASDINRSTCIQMLRFSLPLCLATISYWLLSGFTKISVINNLGVSENGQYAVANRLASMITIFVNVFQFAWNEVAYLMANDRHRKGKYGESITFLFKTVIFGSAVVCIIIKLIFPYFINLQYLESFNIIPISIIGVAFNAVAGFLGTFFMTEKKTNHILYTTVVVAIINCIMCVVTIDSWGLLGAVGILSASFGFLMVLRLVILAKKFWVPMQLCSFGYVLIYVATFVVYYSNLPLWINWLYIVLLGLLYLFSIRKYAILIIKK